MASCLFDIIFGLLPPRLVAFLIGAACIWGGWYGFGEVRRGDAPLRRTLGPAGITLEAKVLSQRSSSGTDSQGNATSSTGTRLEYEHGGQTYREETYLSDFNERGILAGGSVTCRIDPENPTFITSAKTPWPWTKTKLSLCVALIVVGALVDLAVLASLGE